MNLTKQFDEEYEKSHWYWYNPFPSSTSTFTVANIKNLHLTATNLSQVLFDTSRVESITVDNNSSFDILWKLKNPFQIVDPNDKEWGLGPGDPLKHCSDTKINQCLL